MFGKIFFFILLIKLLTICESFVPIYFGHDSAVIVDTDNNVAQKRYNTVRFPAKIMPPPFPLWRNYPRYHILPPPPPPGQIFSMNNWAKTAKSRTPFTSTTTTKPTSTTTTTTTPKPTLSSTSTFSPFLRDDEFPAELLDIAQNKLGLRSLDEIPSITELGQLIGTNSPEETLEYMKKLTLNEQGIALMKAYIESADYTDKTGELNSKDLDNETEDEDEEEDEDMIDDIEEPVEANDNGLVVVTDEDSNDDNEINNEEEVIQDNTLKTDSDLNENNQSIMGRLANYMHINNLFGKAEDNEKSTINRITENGIRISKEEKIQTINQNNKDDQLSPKNKINNLKTPISVRESIPFNYPIPIRIQTSTTSTTLPPTSDTTVVHLNTPKVLIPHMHQISKVTKIPVAQIEDFMASKPKLLDLVTKVSRFPIGYDRNSPIESQVVAAVQKAFEEDEDLKILLSSKATLK